MANQQLVEFIRQMLAQNQSSDEILQTLLAKGWGVQDINDALDEVGPIGVTENTQTVPTTSGAKLPDIFKIINSAFSIYKEQLGLLCGIGLLQVLVAAAILGFGFGLSFLVS